MYHSHFLLCLSFYIVSTIPLIYGLALAFLCFSNHLTQNHHSFQKFTYFLFTCEASVFVSNSALENNHSFFKWETDQHFTKAGWITIFTCVKVELVYKSTPHFQGQKSDFSSFLIKEVEFWQIEISQKVNLLFLMMHWKHGELKKFRAKCNFGL